MIFAIESNSLKLSLCLLSNGKLISNFSLSFKNELSEILIPAINNFLKKNTITLKDISFLAIGCGPGSFTSIRTLIAAAKGIIISNKHIKLSFLILIFGARFIVEFFKVGQTARDEVLFINTGQMLSIPFVLIGVYLIYNALSKKRDNSDNKKEPLV